MFNSPEVVAAWEKEATELGLLRSTLGFRHVTGCDVCRESRNIVRAARAAAVRPEPTRVPNLAAVLDDVRLTDARRRFDSVVLNDEQVRKVAEVRDRFRNLATIIVTLTPPSREASLALTALEEACFWNVKAISRDG